MSITHDQGRSSSSLALIDGDPIDEQAVLTQTSLSIPQQVEQARLLLISSNELITRLVQLSPAFYAKIAGYLAQAQAQLSAAMLSPRTRQIGLQLSSFRGTLRLIEALADFLTSPENAHQVEAHQ